MFKLPEAALYSQMTPDLDEVRGATDQWHYHSTCNRSKISNKILLSCFLRFLLLLAFQSIHVTLEEVTVSKLELVDIFRMDNCGNFLILKNSSHQTHELRGYWVRFRRRRDFGILNQEYCLLTQIRYSIQHTTDFAFFPLGGAGLGLGIGLVLPSYLFIQTLPTQILEIVSQN